MKITAHAYLRNRTQWVVPVCPLCGGEHVHGAPDGINDTGGHRVAHCAPQSAGYVIQPIAAPEPAPLEATALNHMFCYTPETADMALIPWPDERGLSDAYDFSTLACYARVDAMTDTERHAFVLAEAVCAMTRDGCPPAAVHACLLGLKEYRDAMPEDNQYQTV